MHRILRLIAVLVAVRAQHGSSQLLRMIAPCVINGTSDKIYQLFPRLLLITHTSSPTTLTAFPPRISLVACSPQIAPSIAFRFVSTLSHLPAGSLRGGKNGWSVPNISLS